MYRERLDLGMRTDANLARSLRCAHLNGGRVVSSDFKAGFFWCTRVFHVTLCKPVHRKIIVIIRKFIIIIRSIETKCEQVSALSNPRASFFEAAAGSCRVNVFVRRCKLCSGNMIFAEQKFKPQLVVLEDQWEACRASRCQLRKCARRRCKHGAAFCPV